jgi:adenine specific DNA methylase Mod
MKYAVDQIVDDIAVIEEIETKEKKEVNLELLPYEIQEGNILVFQDNEYYIDKQYEASRRQTLEEKLEELKRFREEDTE